MGLVKSLCKQLQTSVLDVGKGKGMATIPCDCLEKPRPKENVEKPRLAAGKQRL